MQISKDVNLAECTSFGTGGKSEVFAVAESVDDILEIITTQPKPFWLLGRGANSLISDKGLPGTTIQIQLSAMEFNGADANVESGVIWDSFVQESIKRNLWGIELTSGIPGSVGAAVIGNIAAYGQAVSDTLEWIDVIDFESEHPEVVRKISDELELGYRSSTYTKSSNNSEIVLRTGFKLSKSMSTELKYESALKVARELKLDSANLKARREIIMEARNRTGSLLDTSGNSLKTAGSFFKNPVVSKDIAEHVMAFEQHGVPRESILKQNKIHGGDTMRVSAAHVLLAAGFKKGQSWGDVRLHPDHILKIENTGNATSQEIYDVAQEIISTVKEKLSIDLQPEVRFMGNF